MKTSPARWYREPPPQVDGWPLHLLLCDQEPAMAAVVEPFRDIIMAGRRSPCPNVEPEPLSNMDFLNGWSTMTTGKPRCDMQHPPSTPRRSPYLRDRLAEMPVFRDRERPLPMTPKARCSKATAAMLPVGTRDNGLLPSVIATLLPIGSVAVFTDDSIPAGVIEIDGTRITLDEMRAACEGL